MDIWTFITSTFCSVISLISSIDRESCHVPATSSTRQIYNQVYITPVKRETSSYLPLAVQIIGNCVEQTLNTQMKQIVYDSFITKELNSSSTTAPEDTTVTKTEAPTTLKPVKSTSSTKAPKSRSGSENFEQLKSKYEAQLKRAMISELFDVESEDPIGEQLLFKSGDVGGVVSHDLDSLPGSKSDPNYWQPDANKLLDSIKVAEMFRQISPDLITVGELRDHLISEAIHRRLRNTSGLSSYMMYFLHQINSVSARQQMLIILQKILSRRDISERKTVELANKVIDLLKSPQSRLSQAVAHCSSIRYS